MKQDLCLETEKRFVQNRDMQSLKVLYKHYYKSLCFFAYSYLKDEEAAKDQVQDVFVDLLEKDFSINDAAKLKGYLYSMVRNRCLNALRAGKVREDYAEGFSELDYEQDASLRIIKSEVYREINACLQKVPMKYREVFELSYLKQMREVEVAERLGITIDMVKAYKKAAKKILREELKYLFALILFVQS
ncbi:MAG: RNA polymerase sigma-70 factor [Mangrovibacterium sp.]